MLAQFLKKDIFAGADSFAKLMKIHVQSKDNWCSYKDVDLGVAAKNRASTVQGVRRRKTEVSHEVHQISVWNKCEDRGTQPPEIQPSEICIKFSTSVCAKRWHCP